MRKVITFNQYEQVLLKDYFAPNCARVNDIHEILKMKIMALKKKLNTSIEHGRPKLYISLNKEEFMILKEFFLLPFPTTLDAISYAHVVLLNNKLEKHWQDFKGGDN